MSTQTYADNSDKRGKYYIACIVFNPRNVILGCSNFRSEFFLCQMLIFTGLLDQDSAEAAESRRSFVSISVTYSTCSLGVAESVSGVFIFDRGSHALIRQSTPKENCGQLHPQLLKI